MMLVSWPGLPYMFDICLLPTLFRELSIAKGELSGAHVLLLVQPTWHVWKVERQEGMYPSPDKTNSDIIYLSVLSINAYCHN